MQVVPGAQRACAKQGLRRNSPFPHPSRPSRAAPSVSSIHPHAQLHPLHSSTWGGGAVCPKRPGGARRACTCADPRSDGLPIPRAQQCVLSAIPSLTGRPAWLRRDSAFAWQVLLSGLSCLSLNIDLLAQKSAGAAHPPRPPSLPSNHDTRGCGALSIRRAATHPATSSGSRRSLTMGHRR